MITGEFLPVVNGAYGSEASYCLDFEKIVCGISADILPGKTQQMEESPTKMDLHRIWRGGMVETYAKIEAMTKVFCARR